MSNQDEKVRLIANQIIRSQQQIERARVAMVNSHNSMSGDQKRDAAWCEYGFPDVVTAPMLYKMYKRVPLAFGGVDKTVKRCWHTTPWVESPDKHWANQVNKILDADFWAQFAEADRRRLAGRFCGIVLRYREGTTAGRPYSYSDSVARKQRSLHSIMPVWETKLTPTEFYVDGEFMGLPSAWQYQPDGYGGTKLPAYTINSERMFMLGDIDAGGYAFLEAAFNDLINIEKITGGSGESFLKNASRQLHINYNENIDIAQQASQHGIDAKALKASIDEQMQNMNKGNDSALFTQGATSNMLVAPVSDPEKPYGVTVQNVASSFNMPTKILVGSQSGERASVEDYKEWNETCQSRRTTVLSKEIECFILTRLVAHGLVGPAPEFTICWDDLTESSTSEKLANAKQMADINYQMAAVGDMPPFSSKRIAEVAGEDVEIEQRFL